MRVALLNEPSAELFSQQLIDIGNGRIPVDITTGLISFPQDFCQFTTSKTELISKVFPDVTGNYKNHHWLSQRAILAAKNKDVDELNIIIQNEIDGQIRSYKSVDSVTSQEDVVNYPTEFLNSLELPGLPPHNLQLKVGSVIFFFNFSHYQYFLEKFLIFTFEILNS